LEIHNNVLDADVGPGGESHEPYQEQADVLQNSRTENVKTALIILLKRYSRYKIIESLFSSEAEPEEP
jgi:hypothetical protein